MDSQVMEVIVLLAIHPVNLVLLVLLQVIVLLVVSLMLSLDQTELVLALLLL
jgi:hypothetical protein